MGLVAYSNPLLFSSSNETSNKGWFSLDRYRQTHVVTFLIGTIFVIMLSLLEKTVIQMILRWIRRGEQIEGSSNDYLHNFYKLMDPSVLIREYEKTLELKQKLGEMAD